MNEVLAAAIVGGIVMALAAGFHWGLQKLFPRIPWRVSVGVMALMVLGLAFLTAVYF
jgi:hypothetical protein